MKRYNLLILLLVFVSQGLFAQTLVTAPMNQANTSGEYYSPTSITLSPGFSTLTGGTFHAYISNCVPLAAALSTDQNYIAVYTPKIPFAATTDLTLQSICDVMQTVKYFDGLGRPLQTIQVKGSPTFKDVIQPFTYDIFGQEVKKYLPYTTSSNDGSYKADALTAGAGIADFYNPAGSTTVQLPNGSPRIPSPFAETSFEASMLNRTVEQGAPGDPWKLTQGHTVKTAYSSNANNEVIRYIPSLQSGSAYKFSLGSLGTLFDPNLLTKVVSKDENWQSTDGVAGTIETYTDQEGHVVLKRIYNQITGGTIEKLETYYIYDDYGNLIFVLPPYTYGTGAPLAPNSYAVPTQQQLDDICYQYRYDSKNRLIEKKLPGKGWEFMVYNKANQLVMSQDANQRHHTNQDWIVTKYDKFGRVVVTGIFTEAGSAADAERRINMQSNVDAVSANPNWEEWTGDAVIGYLHSGTYNNYPTTLNTTLTVNYYDNYTFPGASTLAAQSIISSNVKGLATGSKVFTTAGTASYLTINYYDNDGKVIEAVSENSIGGTDRLINSYSFDGRLLTSIRTHTKPSQANTTIAIAYTYDQVGRKLQTQESINGNPQVILSQLNYNEVGQLITKKLHSTNGGISFINTASYTYNERGWLNGINDPDAVNTSTVFAEALTYNAGMTPMYNGNIASMSWQTMVPTGSGLYQQKQSYSYTYDKINRLITAKYSDPTVTDKFNEELTYDQRGNITLLQRKNNAATGVYLNNLTYNYGSGATLSNRLLSVTDVGTAAQGSSYNYDINGNVVADSRNQITNVTYNYLNLPDVVTRTPGNVKYIYAANGAKLKKVSGAITRDYVGGIEYNNGVIEFIQTEEGRAYPSGSNYIYEYYLKDHLGNTRAAIKQDGSITQVQDYYTFGMDMNPGNAYSSSLTNNYKYNGKEKQQETGEYDYGARFYDPLIARWNTVDPLAEISRRWSPYNYAENNPIRFIDPDGMSIETFSDAGNIAKLLSDARIQGADEKKSDDDGDKDNDKKKQAQTGSYTITYKNGMKYHGKGSLQRAKQSAKEHATKDNPVAENGIDWTPADSHKQAFKDEDDRMNTDEGGNKSDANYNDRASPGKKIKEEEKKKAEAEKRNKVSVESNVSTVPANNFSPTRGLNPIVKTVTEAAAGITLAEVLNIVIPVLIAL